MALMGDTKGVYAFCFKEKQKGGYSTCEQVAKNNRRYMVQIHGEIIPSQSSAQMFFEWLSPLVPIAYCIFGT